MRYYSDELRKIYDSKEELEKAELAAKMEKEAAEIKAKKRQEERKTMAERVEKARKAMVAAQKNYRQELESFIKAYGSYHYSSDSADDIPTLFSFFDLF